MTDKFEINEVVSAEHQQVLKLSKADAMLLIEALERPAKPNAKLRAAAKEYATKTQ